MKTFRDFFENDSTELDERVDSLMTRIKRAKALRKNRAKIKMGQKYLSKLMLVIILSLMNKSFLTIFFLFGSIKNPPFNK